VLILEDLRKFTNSFCATPIPRFLSCYMDVVKSADYTSD
jgi:hypothetical protein